MTEAFGEFSFVTAGRIIFGRGRAAEAPELLTRIGISVLLVHGRAPERAAWLRHALEASGARVTPLACPGEPTLAMLQDGLAVARAAKVDVVVSLGGGAAIDLGKAIAALVPADGDVLDYLEVVGRGLPLPAAPLPFIAMPTTAGTGAEVTKNAVIGVPGQGGEKNGRKVSLRDDRMLPDIALVDPALTDGLPKSVTLASGLDALTQVIEPYLSSRANPMTDALCRDAIPRALPALQKLMRGEDPAARDEMAWVSLCGGLALANAGLGAVHGLAGVIGGATGAAHGAVCGVLLPHVLMALRACNAPETTARRLDEIGSWLGSALGCSTESALPTLAAWAMENGLGTISQLGVTPADFPRFAEMSRVSSSMKASPITFSAAELESMLQAADGASAPAR
jgi:alcohol dehydrogenase class IV